MTDKDDEVVHLAMVWLGMAHIQRMTREDRNAEVGNAISAAMYISGVDEPEEMNDALGVLYERVHAQLDKEFGEAA